MALSIRPGKLFDGLEHCRGVIFLSAAPWPGRAPVLATTRFHRWPTEAREHLFAQLEFAHCVQEPLFPDHFPKSASDLQESIFAKLRLKATDVVASVLNQSPTDHFIFYQEATEYWVKATYGLPYYAKNGRQGPPAHGRFLYFREARTGQAVCALLNSSLFYAYFITYGDCFHLSDTLVSWFPVSPVLAADPKLVALNGRLMHDLTENAVNKTIRTKAGDSISYAEFYASKSKPILDAIDCVIAEHYGFTDEELDFILNYDIKYRMGQDAEEGADD
jgi:hypothetical protein